MTLDPVKLTALPITRPYSSWPIHPQTWLSDLGIELNALSADLTAKVSTQGSQSRQESRRVKPVAGNMMELVKTPCDEWNHLGQVSRRYQMSFLGVPERESILGGG